MKLTADIGRWIHTEIKNQGREIKQFAEDTGLSEPLMWCWKAGKCCPRTFTVALALDELGYKVTANGKSFNLFDISTEINRIIGNQAITDYARKTGVDKEAIYRAVEQNNVRITTLINLFDKLGIELEVIKND